MDDGWASFSSKKRRDSTRVEEMGPVRIPERLSLSVTSTVGEGEKKDGGVVEEGKKIVFVQCLFVEIKSASDKLDERQED